MICFACFGLLIGTESTIKFAYQLDENVVALLRTEFPVACLQEGNLRQIRFLLRNDNFYVGERVLKSPLVAFKMAADVKMTRTSYKYTQTHTISLSHIDIANVSAERRQCKRDSQKRQNNTNE